MVRPAVVSLLAALGGAVALAGCGGGGIGPGPLDAAISRTFTNLYIMQQVEQGDPRPRAADLRTSADCRKGTPDMVQQGPGNDWVCHVTFLVAGPATPVVAAYNLDVKADGCFAADGDGPASVNGSRTITGPGYKQIPNPLWLMDGCFDIT